MTVAQPASAATPELKAAASSDMHAAYCATVVGQDAGMLPQLATAGPAARQPVSWLWQFCSNWASVDGLLEIPKASPASLHSVAWLIVRP